MEKLMNLYKETKDFFWGIGYFGWHIAVLYTIIVCYYHSIGYMILFIILLLLFGEFNKVLKIWIKNPRPFKYILFLANEKVNEKIKERENKLKQQYRVNGMPSGHTQISSFALTIAYLITHKYLYQSIGLFIIIFIQRYVFKNHTILQLFVGGVFGVIIGILSFKIMNLIEYNLYNL